MKKAIMIGLDGATFYLLKPLMENGVMPYLKQFVNEGVHGDLMSTQNPLTPPAWVSMVTGRSPEVHGIFDFLRPVPGASNILFRPYDFRDIRCETLWSIANRHGKRVTSLNFYGMSPPPEVDGYMIGGFTGWKHLRSACYPESLFEMLKSSSDFDYKDLGMDINEEKRAMWGLPEEEQENWLRMHLDRDAAWTQLICQLMQKDPTEVTALVFDGTDKLQHLFWNYIDPALVDPNPSEKDAHIRNLCLDYYRLIDNSIQQIVDLAGSDANIILTSDHGFGPTTDVVYINEWLSRNGYLTWSDKAEVDGLGRQASEYVKDNRTLFDWEKTTAYCMTASSNSIFVKVDHDQTGHGIAPENYPAFCRELQQKLLDYRHPKHGTPVFVNVHLNQARLADQDSIPTSPDIVLNLHDGGFVSILKSPEIVEERKVIGGTHRPNGIFIGRGPDLKEGEHINPLSILDMTPLMLYLAGVPIPSDLEGRVPTEIIKQTSLQDSPVTYGERSHSPMLYEKGFETDSTEQETRSGSPSGTEASEEQRAQLMEQLKLLGYME
ncbi:MAG: phosphodiesterase [Cyanobacteria bacterium]|jgi:predicted AlkP superfamily phosphohydrolase/phosphomutase|nr:phosphodiesterase [Cyanobacteria bacterium GSL.Bin21]